MSWIRDVFNVSKPVIAMVHLEALPGDPAYHPQKGMDWVVERSRHDMLALQSGGVDAVMFSNERSLPYLTKVDPITTICMARVITELTHELDIPFGVNVLWDATASIDLAVATGAKFVREIFTGVYASDFGLWDTNCGEVVRHQHAIHGQDVKLLYNIFPEASVYIGDRTPESIARSTVFNTKPDGLCVSGLTAGSETDAQLLKKIKLSVQDTPVFANTGVNLSNVEEQLRIADGVIVGTTFKREGYIWNEVDVDRTREFMQRVKSIRNGN
ncbi:MAG: BtpA/SgcQ family protein [Anaerolineales bacterium]|nr:BtpA/SgcQ family protein [Chloroflexota bacterium]MBL6982383.1 BtpA/SgcQ family protein [Anaerolineales bacterium]